MPGELRRYRPTARVSFLDGSVLALEGAGIGAGAGAGRHEGAAAIAATGCALALSGVHSFAGHADARA
jgi:hypothetical protein